MANSTSELRDIVKGITGFDIMADKPVQCFTGTRSLFKNLELIPEDYLKLFNP